MVEFALVYWIRCNELGRVGPIDWGHVTELDCPIHPRSVQSDELDRKFDWTRLKWNWVNSTELCFRCSPSIWSLLPEQSDGWIESKCSCWIKSVIDRIEKISLIKWVWNGTDWTVLNCTSVVHLLVDFCHLCAVRQMDWEWVKLWHQIIHLEGEQVLLKWH